MALTLESRVECVHWSLIIRSLELHACVQVLTKLLTKIVECKMDLFHMFVYIFVAVFVTVAKCGYL